MLRVRGMWIVDNPTRTFANLTGVQENPSCHFVSHTLIRKSKWEEMLKNMDSGQSDLAQLKSPKFKISDVQVDDPNEPNKKLACKLIRIQLA